MEYPKIDYLYWRDAYEKTITGSKPNKRVQNSLDRIRSIILKDYPEKSNNKLALLLRRPNLEDRDMSKIKQLADEIADEILDESNEDIKELKYLTIFDAINAWGGISARGMYVQEIKEYQNQTTRKGWKKWIDKYIEGVKSIELGELENALKNFDREDNTQKGKETKTGIHQMGIAFATKHLWYWSEFYINKWGESESQKPIDSKLNERYVVFDMRISRLLFYIGPDNIPYYEALKKFNVIKNDFNLLIQNKSLKLFDNSDIEKALFAFSQYYFANDIDVWGDCDYTPYPDSFTKEKYIEITKKRIQTCKEQRQNLSNGVDFEIACQIFSNTEPDMHSWMNGAEITPKEKTKSKNGTKIKKCIPKEKTIGNPNNKLYVEKGTELEYPWIKTYLSSNNFTGTSGKIYTEINPNQAKSFYKFVIM